MARLSGPTSTCPSCGAGFTQRRWAPAADRDEDLFVSVACADAADIVQNRIMTIRCRDGHQWRVGRWHKSTHKGDRYELEPW